MQIYVRDGLYTARWGGAAFVLGHILFLMNKLDEMSRWLLGRPMNDVIAGDNLLLIGTGQAALLVGFVAYYRVYAPRVVRLGKWALRLLCGGGIVLAVGHVSVMTALPEAMLPGAAFMWVFIVAGTPGIIGGLIGFGLVTLRHPVLRHGAWLPLATGILGFLGFVVARGIDNPVLFLVFRTMFALGLIGLGLILWGESPAAAGPAARDRLLAAGPGEPAVAVD
jgi:hypothetical protein